MAHDRLGKTEPVGSSLRRQMIQTGACLPPCLLVACRQALRHDMRRGIGNGTAPGRCAELIRNDAQLLAFLCQTAHDQQGILAMRAIDPAGAQDQVWYAR